MLAAEILKLRRNRALIAFAAILSIGAIVIVFGYTAIQHASNPVTHDPAGGLHAFTRAIKVLALFFGALTAVLIGGEAGTADISSGVFRDLVATGRSRLALFFVRAPAAIIVTLALTMTAFALALIGTFVFADGLPTPSFSLIIQSALWIILSNAVVASLAVAVGSVTGSRALTLTGVIALETIVTQLLLNVNSLGSARDALPNLSLGQLIPIDSVYSITFATGTAVAVIVAWVVIPAAIGAWRTNTREA
jgi:hypothetical protein